MFSTPLYDLDTNSFIRGGLSWDIYHNPFQNIFLAGMAKISSIPEFIISFQILAYSLSASFLAHLLFSRKTFLFPALFLAAFEPVSMFYNFSFLPESFYTSFTLLYCAFLILYFRKPGAGLAFLFGLGMGLAFLCKLSAMTQSILFGLILLSSKNNISVKIKHLAMGLAPFIACYLFVLIGQRIINEAGLYVVSGRVRWDFANSQYHPEEIQADEFKRYVHPHFLTNGKLPAGRELRRELSFLGYKNCVDEYTEKTRKETVAIHSCDSIFGDVGSQILSQHRIDASLQFIRDNFYALHHLNYLDYRFTKGLPYYHDEKEYQYLDSLMQKHYGFSLVNKKSQLPQVWKNLSFSNIYIPVLWWSILICILISGGWHLKNLIKGFKKTRRISGFNFSSPEIIIPAFLLAIPWLFHLVYISYRPRFLAPYFVIGIFSMLYFLFHLLLKKTERKNSESDIS